MLLCVVLGQFVGFSFWLFQIQEQGLEAFSLQTQFAEDPPQPPRYPLFSKIFRFS